MTMHDAIMMLTIVAKTEVEGKIPIDGVALLLLKLHFLKSFIIL